jgi:hypothetical protein
MKRKDLDGFILALELTEIIVSLFAFSPPLGILAGAAIVCYLYLMSKENDNNEDRDEK